MSRPSDAPPHSSAKAPPQAGDVSPATGAADPSFFQRPMTIGIILGSFFVFTLPLVLLRLTPNFSEVAPWLMLAQVVGLGFTHFAITGVLYLKKENLRHFASTPLNKLIYFGIPIAIFLLAALMGATTFSQAFPLVAIGYFVIVRIFDFTHVTRQTFGVLQLFKGPAGRLFPTWVRPAENFLLLGIAGLQLETFVLGGGVFRWDHWAVKASVVAVGALLVVVLGAWAHVAIRSPERRLLLVPFAYFLLQLVSAVLVVYMTALYFIALSMHYVEYHVVMGPRCLGSPLDESSRSDRLLGVLRSNKILFYSMLLGIAVVVQIATLMPKGGSFTPGLFMLHAFNGIFLFHFFVESFVWRFRNPHYRQTLAPLYGPRSKAPAIDPAPAARRRISAALAGVVVVATLVAAATGALDPLAAMLTESTGRQAAQSQAEFGMQRAQEGRREEAIRHFREVLELQPGNPQAREMLRRLEGAAALPPSGGGPQDSPARPGGVPIPGAAAGTYPPAPPADETTGGDE